MWCNLKKLLLCLRMQLLSKTKSWCHIQFVFHTIVTLAQFTTLITMTSSSGLLVNQLGFKKIMKYRVFVIYCLVARLYGPQIWKRCHFSCQFGVNTIWSEYCADVDIWICHWPTQIEDIWLMTKTSFRPISITFIFSLGLYITVIVE